MSFYVDRLTNTVYFFFLHNFYVFKFCIIVTIISSKIIFKICRFIKLF